MPIHNEAKFGEIAKTVLMPGDPLRAQYIAERYLTDAQCVNNVKGMLAYTGKYQGKPITVMGSGMGVPSMGIYANELYTFYDVENIIRIGSCGAYTPNLELRDLILVTESYYEGAYALQLTGKENHFCLPDAELNLQIASTAEELNIPLRQGKIASVEAFDPYLKDPLSIMKRYQEDPDTADICGSEMESFALFKTAEYFGKRAACLLTVADSSFKDEKLTPEERQNNMNNMIKLALETAYRL